MLDSLSSLFFRRLVDTLSLSGQKLSILIYHRVLAEPDPMRPWEIDAKQFRDHLKWISSVFTVIPLRTAVDQLNNGTLASRSLAITFDDGYSDNQSVALQLLNEQNFQATFFCTTAYIDGSAMWNDLVIEAVRLWPENQISIPELEIESLSTRTMTDKASTVLIILDKLKYKDFDQRNDIANMLASQVQGMPKQIMMSADQIKALHSAGMEIGGHTHSHPILANLTEDKATEQIITNKQILEKIVGQPITLFAYPNGKPNKDYNASHVNMVREAGYKAAVSTTKGASSAKTDIYQLNRFTPWDKSRNRFLARLLMNY